MFDIVAADQHQAAAAVDGGGIDHRQARLPATRIGVAEAVGAEAAHQPGGQPDQSQYHGERDEERRRERHVCAVDVDIRVRSDQLRRSRTRQRRLPTIR